MSHLAPYQDPNLIVGTETSDDAGVYKISNDIALVQTVDFFTPIVDDPYLYGQISAANALSDVYAMGGKPLTALNICCFPKDFPLAPLEKILKGGQDKATEAGVVVLGGHTVQDTELKFGMAVTGLIHPDKALTNKNAKSGDALILTKPLGTGIITTAIKKKKASQELIDRVCHWMAVLNKSAAECLSEFNVHACTDITGFGLTGHTFQMAKASQVSFEIDVASLPHYSEALELAKKGYVTGADKTNREYVKDVIQFTKSFPKEWESLLFDPQTSGGLFISLPNSEASSLLNKLHLSGVSEARIVGRVTSQKSFYLKFS